MPSKNNNDRPTRFTHTTVYANLTALKQLACSNRSRLVVNFPDGCFPFIPLMKFCDFHSTAKLYTDGVLMLLTASVSFKEKYGFVQLQRKCITSSTNGNNRSRTTSTSHASPCMTTKLTYHLALLFSQRAVLWWGIILEHGCIHAALSASARLTHSEKTPWRSHARLRTRKNTQAINMSILTFSHWSVRECHGSGWAPGKVLVCSVSDASWSCLLLPVRYRWSCSSQQRSSWEITQFCVGLVKNLVALIGASPLGVKYIFFFSVETAVSNLTNKYLKYLPLPYGLHRLVQKGFL